MSTAKDTVISTPELLELTLSHLPMRDLLVTAPRVSKTWQATTLCPTLQQALFFQPDPPGSERIQNPLLLEIFPPFFAPAPPSRWDWPNAKSVMSMPWSKASDAFKRPEASWRRMLVTQPPARKMTITEMCHGQIGDSERRAMLEGLELRMGYLYDLTLPLIDRPVSSLCIRWHQKDDLPAESDLTLAAIYTMQCSMGRQTIIDEQFYNEASEYVNIDFGEWDDAEDRSSTPGYY
ncbi:hypothetical protein B0H13DRAFT_1998200 [Mycena leptocephala]|nr:hypothetical protein B0H13DRAFT_1998200 [Mycena leptocephala]